MNYAIAIRAVILLNSLLQVVMADISFFNYDQYEKQCGHLLASQGLDVSSHTILLRNCAYTIRNYVSIDQLKEIEKMDHQILQKTLFSGNFWAEKLQREVSIPYSDQEYSDYLLRIQGELNSFLNYLRFVAAKNTTFTLKVYGSMAKGRFGANSSLDIMIESDDDGFLVAIDKGIYSRSNPKFRGNIEVITSNRRANFLLEPFHSVSQGELSNLERVYNEILTLHGFKLIRQQGKLSIVKTGLPRANLEFNPIEDRIHYLIKKLDTILMQTENSYEVFSTASSAQNSNVKQETLKNLNDLKRNLNEVQLDLQMILNQSNSDRLQKIKSVIEPTSYDRLKRYRSKRLSTLIEEQLILIERKSQVLMQAY